MFASLAARSPLRGLLLVLPLAVVATFTPTAAPAADPRPTAGLLLMAHGGSPEWNAAVEQAVLPIRSERPVAIAFGMADRASLQAAASELATRGATRIDVVRLFLYRDSFLHQTEYLLGLRPDPPSEFVDHAAHSMSGYSGHRHGGAANDSAATAASVHGASAPARAAATPPSPIRCPVPIRLSHAGLLDDPVAGEILRERARHLSRDARHESVLLLAHGAGDEAENSRILARIEGMAQALRDDAPYAAVRGETLREDWPEPRARAEKRIREFVASEHAAGRRVLVLPVRLFGFGEYRQVLKGLTYTADELGLLPSPAITGWIRAQLADLEESRAAAN